MTQDRIPYTYLIGWSDHDKWYYGRRSGKGCNPLELWVRYFTSSKEVKRFRSEYGDPDVIQIRKIFNDPIDARYWENKVLERLNVSRNVKFLNRRSGDKTNIFNTSNTAHAKTLDGKKLGSVSLLDPRWKTGEIVGIQFGVKHSVETLEKMSKSKKKTTTAIIMLTGQITRVSIEDPRWKTGEIVGVRKGQQYNKQSEDHKKRRIETRRKNAIPVSINTKQHLSEVRKGKKPAYDINGNFIELISTTDSRWNITIFTKRQLSML